MRVFTEVVRKALNDYKQILKRSLPDDERNQKLEELGLLRRDLMLANDAVLYQKATNVIKDIQRQLRRNETTPAWYSGLDEFCYFLENELKQYCLDKNKVLHIAQQASRSLIDAIQLMSLPNTKLDDIVAEQLQRANQLLMRYGSKEQITQLKDVYRAHKTRNLNFFLPLLKQLEVEKEPYREAA